jgi:hypothetical protein
VTGATRRALDLVPGRLTRRLPSGVRADLRHRTGLTVPGDLAFAPVPPAPAAGERCGPPDFAVLGAADAGCDWWLSLVADHPDVAPGHRSAEAAQFFAPYCTEPFGPDEIAAFCAWFPRRPGRIVGYWSPDALAYAWVVPLLALAAPGARMVVLVRDPVDRLLDGLARTADRRPEHPGSWLSDAVDRGFYADQLDRLHQVYPPDRVLVLQYERCVADPVGSLTRTYAFLGVDPTYRARPLGPPAAADGSARDRLDPRTLDRLRGMYAADVAALAARCPDVDLDLWPNCSHGR